MLVILSELAVDKSTIFFHKITNSKTPNQFLTNSSFKFQKIQTIIAFTVCDTTSTFFGIGKSSILTLDKELLKNLANYFYDRSYDKKKVVMMEKLRS